ncbi:hypothetical protein O6H91_04G020600 [Diphasiastrum complanatum]|uniref:Uncharacterized protein n=2 Tax=Diphasiastrum complanatum TaxID=34168 RepID=A0ACC2DUK6_DIPCM|nr:hypothetical protein O6H91_Y195600 [Diphasiastrum complanatum]KAJ7557907.1 hypothetical protein O6H91_04G015000 [Diphasiastrum complanatum]KAJ7557994.1 hypothetical protein O6H91_04G020600 [Diphasiastrum complanatum]
MGTLRQGGIGIATVLAVSGGVILLALRNSSIILKYAFLKQLAVVPYVQRARATYSLPSVHQASGYSAFLLYTINKIRTPVLGAGAKDSDSTRERITDVQLLSPASVLPGVRGSPARKKKVRFAASVVEPKGDNQEYRRNPKSSRLRRQADQQSTSDLFCEHTQTGSQEQDIETGLASSQNLPSHPHGANDCTPTPLRSNSTSQGQTAKSKRVSPLFDPRLPRNRVAQYSHIY